MLKNLLVAGVVGSVMCANAFAASYKGEGPCCPPPAFRPYVGINVNYLHNSYESSVQEGLVTYNPNQTNPNNFWGGSIDAGYRYGQYFGMEFGYAQYANGSSTSGTTKVSVSPRTAYMDLRGYYPIDQWDLIGIAGVGIASIGDASLTNTATGAVTTIHADSSVAPRLGLGVDYNFNRCWGARLEGRYTFASSRYVNYSYSFDAGVFYNFDV